MSSMTAQHLTISVAQTQHVSALLEAPRDARACFVLAHGAGAGMHHPFLERVAAGLAGRGCATLRFQFPYMERGARRPDLPRLAQDTVRAAVAEASRRLPHVALFAGGKSFGGRMTSQAQAELPLAGVRGLVFLGFPLHPAGRPSDTRARHLSNVAVPMLFLQGTRDALASLPLMTALADRLGPRATLTLLQDADHSFRPPARSGRTAAQVEGELLDALTAWLELILQART